MALATEALRTAALMSNSREHEHEADLEGVRMLHEAGIDPAHAIAMLESLPHGHLPDAFNWLSSHPDVEERVEAIRELVADLPERDYSPLDFDLAALRAAIKNRKPVNEIAEDEKAEKNENNNREENVEQVRPENVLQEAGK